MPLSEASNLTFWQGIVSIVTGGALVGWYREKRRGKKDAYEFAMQLLDQQNGRIDALVFEVAQLKAKLEVEASAVHILKAENEKLKMECARLKTALAERNR